MKQVIRRVWKKRDGQYYVSTIKHPVKAHVWCCFSQYGFGKLKLLEDNDPKHTSKMCKRFKVDNGIQSLAWPSQSPDCNPIENIWSLLKIKINKQPPTSIKKFIRRIEKEWRSLPIEFAEKLVASMKYRVELLIERKGDYINY
ncbi:unnamed protein product [Rotaria magnacalcarata]|uniref:Tc1-like transposase DDE domain-containing protein n=1 Tax=Rotaria magnacalcarata TaxID=392030 RepID=A0A816M8R7_9BILA|nr:unnamed protein product [Rotaria magnacalcarata]CAF3971028.1 unnamed protein product [Rotaria magnacalcarata]CAF3975601.1 unnamed protein product [Rotaria magnacalcarata]CAF4209513.1 unnamed protein product [Rotaria magnacalcarata]